MIKRKSIYVLLLVVLAILMPVQCADASAARQSQSKNSNIKILDVALSPEALAWAKAEMESLTLRQRIGQLVIPRLDVSDNQAGRAAVRRMVVDYGVGGLLFGKGTLSDYAGLIAYAQSEAKIPLMVTLDGEWGLKMRVTDAPHFPVNMAVGASTDMEAIEAYGAEVARECRALGINVNFAPDVDVNSNPRNPVIGYRSFGEDPARVAAAGIAYSRGLESGGVLSVSKHFPGHGDTSTDSHKALPTVNHTAERLESVDLLPFRRYIDAGLGGVMVGHLNVPALDKSGHPASLSKAITTDLLRKRMKFRGLVFTDALAMAGANTGGNNCVEALKAGTDILLQPKSVKADIEAVVKAVESGKIARSVIDERCLKVLCFKYTLGLTSKPELMSKKQAVATVNNEQSRSVLNLISKASLTCIYNNDGTLPVNNLSGNRVAVVSIGAKTDNIFSSTCARYTDVKKFSVNAEHGVSKKLLNDLEEYDVVIIAAFSDKEWAREAFAKIHSCRGAVGVFFMNPYKMSKFGGSLKDLSALVLAGDDTPSMREAAAEGVFGGCAMTGRLPVDINGVAKMGSGVSTSKVRLGFVQPIDEGFSISFASSVDSAMEYAVTNGAVPGCQILVAKGGNVVLSRNYGVIDPVAKTRVNDSTIYDLASMTKAIATVPGLMRAYDEDLFGLNDPISKAVSPLKNGDKSKITYSDALYHISGMPAMISAVNIFAPKNASRKRELRSDLVSRREKEGYTTPLADGLWLNDCSIDTVMQRIYDAELKQKGKYLYSDLNFCLLKDAEERLTEVPHEEWVATEIFGPVGATTLGFNPLNYYPLKYIAPTENDTELRNQRVRGYVHDETAAVSGGVQGNAGLFGNALDVAKVCQMLLDRGQYGGSQIISEKTIKEFTSSRSRRKLVSARGKEANRGLGFAFVDDDSPASAATYGHTGFTGTCFWIDPESDIIMVFLSNRVCPSRKTPAFFRNDPRQALMKVIYDDINR